jgi:hypothetical protein
MDRENTIDLIVDAMEMVKHRSVKKAKKEEIQTDILLPLQQDEEGEPREEPLTQREIKDTFESAMSSASEKEKEYIQLCKNKTYELLGLSESNNENNGEGNNNGGNNNEEENNNNGWEQWPVNNGGVNPLMATEKTEKAEKAEKTENNELSNDYLEMEKLLPPNVILPEGRIPGEQMSIFRKRMAKESSKPNNNNVYPPGILGNSLRHKAEREQAERNAAKKAAANAAAEEKSRAAQVKKEANNAAALVRAGANVNALIAGFPVPPTRAGAGNGGPTAIYKPYKYAAMDLTNPRKAIMKERGLNAVRRAGFNQNNLDRAEELERLEARVRAQGKFGGSVRRKRKSKRYTRRR